MKVLNFWGISLCEGYSLRPSRHECLSTPPHERRQLNPQAKVKWPIPRRLASSTKRKLWADSTIPNSDAITKSKSKLPHCVETQYDKMKLSIERQKQNTRPRERTHSFSTLTKLRSFILVRR
jgi:hypothetical protein